MRFKWSSNTEQEWRNGQARWSLREDRLQGRLKGTRAWEKQSSLWLLIRKVQPGARTTLEGDVGSHAHFSMTLLIWLGLSTRWALDGDGGGIDGP